MWMRWGVVTKNRWMKGECIVCLWIVVLLFGKGKCSILLYSLQ